MERDYKHVLGARAEDYALGFLERKGLIIRERNWRNKHKEIDLIMESKSKLHIIEVRSLSEPYLVRPVETINQAKRNNIISAASSYVRSHAIVKDTQFDLVSVIFKNDRVVIEYYPDAFTPIW